MAEHDNAQIRDSRKATAQTAVNHDKQKTILARRAAIISHRYNTACKHRIAQGAS